MKSIRTILACIRKADQTYNLIIHGDKIIIGVSGGKDSMLLLYALSLYQKFSHTDFVIQPVTLDLGFPNFDPTLIKDFCKNLGYELIVKDSRDVYKILTIQQKDKDHLPCSICSRMKKAAINKVANELGFNKVAFAHHADDAVETFMMNEIYGGRIATFAPKMLLENANIVFIRPLLLCKEKEIVKCVKEENIPILGSSCPADKHTTREDIKNILKDIYHKYPSAKEGFLNMLSNYEHEDIWNDKIEYQIDNEGLVLKPITLPYEMAVSISIRSKVFIDEQNVPYQEEFVDEEEKAAHTFLIRYKDINIGTIRYIETDKGIMLQRFAILKEYRKKGYGRKVFNYIGDLIFRRYNPTTIYFHAQSYLIEFYKSLGYIPVGDEFIEAGRKHILMKKDV